MLSWVAWLMILAACAVLGTGLYLWFRSVSRIMRERKKDLEDAAARLAEVRTLAYGNRYDPNLAETIKRMELGYKQAEASYMREFRRLRVWLPASVMGYRAVPPEDYYTLGKDNWKV